MCLDAGQRLQGTQSRGPVSALLLPGMQPHLTLLLLPCTEAAGTEHTITDHRKTMLQTDTATAGSVLGLKAELSGPFNQGSGALPSKSRRTGQRVLRPAGFTSGTTVSVHPLAPSGKTREPHPWHRDFSPLFTGISDDANSNSCPPF